MVRTKRTPIARERKAQFTPEALAIFKEMRSLKCSSVPSDPRAIKDTECVDCEEWYRLHSQLHRALQLPPWRWPAIPRHGIGGDARWKLRDQLEAALAELAS